MLGALEASGLFGQPFAETVDVEGDGLMANEQVGVVGHRGEGLSLVGVGGRWKRSGASVSCRKVAVGFRELSLGRISRLIDRQRASS